MRYSAKSLLEMGLRGLSQGLFLIAGFSFFFGGRAIHEFAQVERVLAEADGLILAVAAGLLGLGAKALELRLSQVD
jgi:hypothetical protein